MARDLRPKHKLCRTYGEKLCDSVKCPVTKRSYPPGEHGQQRKRAKLSSYAKQLREKQKAKRLYGLLERQFAKYVEEAASKPGDTSKHLISSLESRLDNVVYRSGLVKTRASGRQLVGHGHVLVNGKKLDIPSYRVKVGDVVSINEKTKKSKLFDGVSETIAKTEFPMWVNVDGKSLTAKILNTPTFEMPNYDANVIIGFYSR